MGLDLWFRDDVARILASSYQAMQVTSQAGADNGDRVLAYRQGFVDALDVVATAFGVVAPGQEAAFRVLDAIREGNNGQTGSHR
jgi:hypothetical protein